MKKVYLFALPLLMLFAPALARLHVRHALDTRTPGAVEAAALSADQTAVNLVHARIREARSLVERQPATSTDAVTLAVGDASDVAIQLLQVPKAVFLSPDAETFVTTAAGARLKLRVVRANYVNTAVSVTDAAGHALEPLLVRYPVEKGGTLSEVAYYTSAHPALAQPELVRAGGQYVRCTLAGADAPKCSRRPR